MSAATGDSDFIDASDWSEEDRARADHYALIAQLFYAPTDAGLLDELVVAGSMFGRAGGAEGGPLAEAWRALAAQAAHCDAAVVAAEYERLFLGVSKPEIMLHGSFYQAGFLNEEPLADLRDDLRRMGLCRRDGVAETEDHIAALCEVMRHLIATGPDQAGLCRQCGFFTRHLQPWYGAFCAALAATPQAEFYKRVGALTQAYFDIESEAFSFD